MNEFPQVFILGSLLLLIYINHLPKITNNGAKAMLFADDINTSILESSLLRQV